MSDNRQNLSSQLVQARQQLHQAQARVADLEAQLLEDQPASTTLMTTEDRYHRVLDNLLEGAEIIGFDWRYLYVNDAVAGHGRQAKDVLLRSTVIELYPGIENTSLFAALRTCMEERIPQHFETEFVFPDGVTTWFELSVQPVPEGIFILSLDITERKRSETALKLYAQRMEILHEIDLGLILGGSIQAVVETALKHLRRLVPCQRADVTLIDEAANEALVFAVGIDGETRLAQGVRVPIPPNVFEGYDARHMRIFDDIRLFQDTRPRARQLVNEGLLSALSVMLMDEEHPIGVLGLFAATSGFFTAEHQEIAVEIANQVAIAIRQLRLSEALERHSALLEQRVNERTAELQSAKERVEAILNNSLDGILLVRPDFTIQQTNAAFNRLFACEIDDYFGEPLAALLTAEHDDHLMEALQSGVVEGQGVSLETRARGRDGLVFDAELSIGFIKQGGFVCSIRDITERKAQERQLRYHASLQANVSDAVIVTDMAYRIQSWNRAAERIYGWLAGEMINQATLHLLRTEFPAPGERERNIQLLYDQGWWQGEMIQHHKDGSVRHILGSITLIKDENGVPFSVVSVNHDITERKKSEEILQESEEKFRLLMDAAPVAIVITNAMGAINLVNEQTEMLFGYPRTELIGQSVDILVPDTSRVRHATNRATYMAMPRVRRMGSGLELFARRKDGREFPVEIELSYIEIRNGMTVMSFVVDITERKRIAAELEQQRTFLREVIDASPSMIFVKDYDARFVLVNPMVAKMYNTTVEALLGKSDADFNPNATEVEAFLAADRRVITSGEPLFVEEPVTAASGDIHWLQTTKVPVVSVDGKAKFVLGVATDITERKKSEEALQQAFVKEKELSELKSRFVAMASHEFRTPLATILVITETLSAYRHRLPDEQIDQRLDRIKEQVDHLRAIMDDVLLLGRMQAQHIEANRVKLDLDSLCRSVLDEFQSLPNVTHHLEYTCNATLREIRLDRKLMRQVISNLVSNAIKYSPEGKTVKVSLDYADRTLVLKVSDQGIGIPEADLPHLFEPFHRSGNVGTIAGTGLGLAITKESVELHGGTITVESQTGVGTTFTVRIPVVAENEATDI